MGTSTTLLVENPVVTVVLIEAASSHVSDLQIFFVMCQQRPPRVHSFILIGLRSSGLKRFITLVSMWM